MSGHGKAAANACHSTRDDSSSSIFANSIGEARFRPCGTFSLLSRVIEIVGLPNCGRCSISIVGGQGFRAIQQRIAGGDASSSFTPVGEEILQAVAQVAQHKPGSESNDEATRLKAGQFISLRKDLITM